VMRIGEKAYACIPRASLGEAWFNLEVQRRLLFERCGIDLVIDVGANAGQFAQALRRSYAGELLSFEPAAAAFRELEAAAAGDAAWRVFNSALGDETSEQSLKVSPQSAFNSFLGVSPYCVNTFGAESVPVSEERVTVRRLDEVAARYVPDLRQRKLFVKLDTQGFDLHVFRGMRGILDRVVAFQSEVSLRALYDGVPGWLECLQAYEAEGFRVAGMFPVVTDRNGYPIEYDCLMVAEGRA